MGKRNQTSWPPAFRHLLAQRTSLLFSGPHPPHWSQGLCGADLQEDVGLNLPGEGRKAEEWPGRMEGLGETEALGWEATPFFPGSVASHCWNLQAI